MKFIIVPLVAASVAAQTFFNTVEPLSLYSSTFGFKDYKLPSTDTSIVSKADQDFWEAQNEMRINPKSFIPELKAREKLFEGKTYDGTLLTTDGWPAVEELITFLGNQTELKPLRWYAGVSRACEKHVKDKKAVGHEGGKGSDFLERFNKYGKVNGGSAENLDYGTDAVGREALLNLAIDDGVKGRGHRGNIFSTVYGGTGVWSGPSGQYAEKKWKETCVGYVFSYTDKAKKIGGATCGYKNGKCDDEKLEEMLAVTPVFARLFILI